MFGTNPVAKPFARDDGALLVHSSFPTLQGEGPDAGVPAVFLRLAHCNLRCYFCDTDFAEGTWYDLEQLTRLTVELARDNKCSLVVITGGEPLLQNVSPLTDRLNKNGIRCSIETAATIFPEGLQNSYGRGSINQIVCSPKTPMLAPRLLPYISAFKYIISAGNFDPDDGLPCASTQIKGGGSKLYRPDKSTQHIPIFLQAMDEGNEHKNKANLIAAAELCRKFGYRLSVQLHKLCDLP